MAAAKTLTRELLEDKLAIWMQRMNLLHWEIRLDLDTPAEAEDAIANAEIVCHPQYDRAELRMGAGWERWVPDDIGDLHVTLDYLLAHELAHCWMRDLDRHTMDDLDGRAHADAIAVFCEIYHRKREHLVDHVARALVDGWGPA